MSEIENEDGAGKLVSAFPSVCLNDPNHPASVPGMSLRDWLAGKFLSGAASTDRTVYVTRDARQHEIDVALAEHWTVVARTAYIAADAMLAARERAGA